MNWMIYPPLNPNQMNYNMQKTSEIVEDTACQAQLYWLSNPMIPITMIV